MSSKNQPIIYHYCAMRPLEGGNFCYVDGLLSANAPIDASNLQQARADIAETAEWESGSFSLISLTRL